ncbi:phage tail-collar fiber domain-containing protein [Providencia sp. wls1921]|uniref:phage tail-collar fiber domain-containing protein n=1 Tax=Providencia sp. wls1921 TaxID=2675153 RepID=UPI0012B554F6|nr:phage tail protein [Providencia sp. wls1921]MTC43681.1 phage tail protein [Providencia sp. wls1921]
MKYFALLTTYGEKVLAEATALGTKIELTHMSVGDGGGSLPAPDTKQTKLINERRKAAINTLFIDPLNPNQIIAEQVIPENEGGWWIREIGLFDKSGALVAVANCPETYKPLLVEGSGRTQTIRVVLIVSHTESVTLKIDPTVVLATRKYVDDAIEVLDKKIKELTAKDVGAVPIADIVQSTGQSTTQIMSQKAATAAIADAKKAGTDAQATANSAASAASSAASAASSANSNANDRLPKTDVVQSTGQSTTQVMSQKAATTAIADAKKAGTDAQATANSAASAASAAQSTANTAKSTADSANANANNRVPSSSIVQATGQSTSQIMSQKAVTEALQSAVNLNAIYPVGIVVWFAQNKNPNTLFPNTKWQYIGENKTIRLASLNGSNVLKEGGSDSVTLTEAQIPAHNHSFSATTSSFDYGTKSTNTTGSHTHPIASDVRSFYGDNNHTAYQPGTGRSSGAAGDHAHTVAIGAHTHTVSGTTGNKGSNNAINITNAYIMLMGWHRVS